MFILLFNFNILSFSPSFPMASFPPLSLYVFPCFSICPSIASSPYPSLFHSLFLLSNSLYAISSFSLLYRFPYFSHSLSLSHSFSLFYIPSPFFFSRSLSFFISSLSLSLFTSLFLSNFLSFSIASFPPLTIACYLNLNVFST